MVRSRSSPQPAPPLAMGTGAHVDLPPALDSAPGRRLQALLDRVPAFDWAHWGREFASWSLHDVAEVLRFSDEGHTRTVLACTDDAEIVLFAWLPGQASAVHGHGISDGLAHILAGHAVEETYALEAGALVRTGERKAWAGDELRETPDQQHRIVNPGPTVLVTLHLYAPRLLPS